MPLLMQHRHDSPVGHVTFAKPSKTGIPFEARLPIIREAGLLKDRVDEAIHSLKYKLIGFVSIGFKAVEGAVKRLENGGLKFEEWTWLELSICTIPANPDAVISSVKAMDEGDRLPQGLIASIKAAGMRSRNGGVPLIQIEPQAQARPAGGAVRLLGQSK